MRTIQIPSTGEVLRVRAIMAVDTKGTIGYNGKLLFHNPEDLKHFQTLTKGNICVMGRKTFESIGKVLPERQTIVFTRSIDRGEQAIEKILEKNPLPPNTPRPVPCLYIKDIADCVDLTQAARPTVYICGGAEIYYLFRKYVKSWLVTRYAVDVEKTKGILPKNYRPGKLERVSLEELTSMTWTTTDHSTFEGIPVVYRTYGPHVGYTLI